MYLIFFISLEESYSLPLNGNLSVVKSSLSKSILPPMLARIKNAKHIMRINNILRVTKLCAILIQSKVVYAMWFIMPDPCGLREQTANIQLPDCWKCRRWYFKLLCISFEWPTQLEPKYKGKCARNRCAKHHPLLTCNSVCGVVMIMAAIIGDKIEMFCQY